MGEGSRGGCLQGSGGHAPYALRESGVRGLRDGGPCTCTGLAHDHASMGAAGEVGEVRTKWPLVISPAVVTLREHAGMSRGKPQLLGRLAPPPCKLQNSSCCDTNAWDGCIRPVALYPPRQGRAPVFIPGHVCRRAGVVMLLVTACYAVLRCAASPEQVTGDNAYERVSGSSIGGGTFWGLCRLLTGVTDFDEMLEFSKQGDNAAVRGGWAVGMGEREVTQRGRGEGTSGSDGAGPGPAWPDLMVVTPPDSCVGWKRRRYGRRTATARFCCAVFFTVAPSLYPGLPCLRSTCW